ncbi:MAG: TlpA disulfide reductase family protein [Candidatus Thermoplasmatota archaeon]
MTLRVVACALVLAFIVPGCAVPTRPPPVESAPPVLVRTVDGREWSLAAHAGSVVVIDLMDRYCGPCRLQSPALAALASEHANDSRFAMLSIDVGESAPDERSNASLKEYRDDERATWAYAFDEGGRVWADYHGLVLPTIVIIATDGTIHAALPGGTRSLDELRGLVREAGGLVRASPEDR